jgi:hypothetical protein
MYISEYRRSIFRQAASRLFLMSGLRPAGM